VGKTTKGPKAKARPMKLTGKSYASVAEMVRGTVGDPEFAERFEERSAARRLVRGLTVLRGARGLTQADLGRGMGCTQAKVSKLESSTDAELSLGDLVAYAHAVGHNVRVVVSPEGATGADHVRFHAASLARALERLVDLAGDDREIGDGVGAFATATALDLVATVRGLIEKLPRGAEPSAAPLQVEVEGGLSDEEAAALPRRVRKGRKAPI